MQSETKSEPNAVFSHVNLLCLHTRTSHFLTIINVDARASEHQLFNPKKKKKKTTHAP